MLNQPYWKYKISNGEVFFEKEESALLRYEDKSSPFTPNTCSSCSNFQDYHESNGRGWCNQFNHHARTNHLKTNDCIVSTQKVEAFPTKVIEVDRDGYPMLNTDSAPSRFQVKSIVKIIDPTEHHNEWGVFEVVEVKNNDHHFDNTDTYLNSSAWVYRLLNTKHEDTYFKHLWVGENEICHFDESHLICTEDIF